MNTTFHVALLCSYYALTCLAWSQVFFTFPSGNGTGLVRAENGSAQFVNTGLNFHDFPRVSPDGSFVTFASQDPATPDEVSTDLFQLDRRNGQVNKLLNFSTTTAPDGTNTFVNPLFSSYSYSNARFGLVFQETQTSNTQPSRNVRVLAVYPAGSPQNFAIAEIGMRSDVQVDLTQSEFRGLSWFPGSATFAAPAYVPVVAQNSGRSTVSTGIVLYSQTGTTPFSYGRVGQLTLPRVVDSGVSIIQSTHIYPAVSPNGQTFAFFDVEFPDPLLQSPVTTRLVVGNTDGTNFFVRLTFPAQQFPSGLSWNAAGDTLIYAMGPQRFNRVVHAPSSESGNTLVWQVAAFGNSAASPIPGVAGGIYPSTQLLTGPGVDLSRVPLTITRNGSGGFLLRAVGLPAGESFLLESAESLGTSFGNPQSFTGAEIAGGISVSQIGTTRFFRLARP